MRCDQLGRESDDLPGGSHEGDQWRWMWRNVDVQLLLRPSMADNSIFQMQGLLVKRIFWRDSSRSKGVERVIDADGMPK